MAHTLFFERWNKPAAQALLRALCPALVWAAVATPVDAWAAGPAEGLPQRNLLIEWRSQGSGLSQDSRAGLRQGRITVDSRGAAVGGAWQAGTVQTESRQDGVQQVQVLNGGRARLYIGQSQPYTVWQWAGALPGAGGSLQAPGQQPALGAGGATAWGGNGQVLPQTVWLDLGQGLSVRPRWPGGQAPVWVEFEAQGREAASPGGRLLGRVDPDGQTRRSEVASTLSVPLGQWVVVARSGVRTEQARSGTFSTRALDESQSDQIEVRITLP